MNTPAVEKQFVSRLVGDSLRYAPAVIIPAFVSVAGVALFTRLLGTNAYGVYSVVAAVISIATVVGAEWIGQSVLRYLPLSAEAGSARGLVGSALGLTGVVCGGVLLAGAVVRVAVQAHPAIAVLVLPTAVLLTAEVAFATLGSILQARLHARSLATFRVVGSVLRFAMAAGFVILVERGVVWLLIGAAIGRSVTVVAMALSVARGVEGWIRPRFDFESLRRFAVYGLPMVGWTVGSQVLGLSDRFVIGAFHGSAPVGIYSANYNLVSMGFGLLSGPLLMAAHPLIVTAWRTRRRDEIADVVASCSRLYVLVVTPILLVLALCSRDIVDILLAADFREGSAVIPVLVLGSFVWGFGMYGHKGLELAERTHIMLVLVVLTAVANVILNLIFVPRFGYPAAAVTTLASNALYPVLVHRVSRRYIPWRIPWAELVRIGALALVAGLAGLAVRRALQGAPPVVVIVTVTAATTLAYAAPIAWWMRRKSGKAGR